MKKTASAVNHLENEMNTLPKREAGHIVPVFASILAVAALAIVGLSAVHTLPATSELGVQSDVLATKVLLDEALASGSSLVDVSPVARPGTSIRVQVSPDNSVYSICGVQDVSPDGSYFYSSVSDTFVAAPCA
jgi:hypothetical protein